MNIGALSDDTRRLILERVRRELGFTKTLEALGIARGSLHDHLQETRALMLTPSLLLNFMSSIFVGRILTSDDNAQPLKPPPAYNKECRG